MTYTLKISGSKANRDKCTAKILGNSLGLAAVVTIEPKGGALFVQTADDHAKSCVELYARQTGCSVKEVQ